MPTSSRLPVILFVTLSLAALPHSQAQTAPATAEKATYKVNLSLALKAGQKFGYVTDSSSTMNMDMVISAPNMPAPQNQQQKQASMVHLEGDAEVLAVTPEGRPKKLLVTVKSLKASKNAQNISGLPGAGAKIIAEKMDTHNTTLMVDGQPLDPTVTKLLTNSFPVSWDGHDDQTMFGTKNPVAVGGTWSPGPALVTALQEEIPGTSAVQGQLKLDGVQGSGDSQVMKVSGNLSLVGAQMPVGPGMNFPAQCTMQMSGTFPASAKGTSDGSMKINIAFSGSISIPGGGNVKVQGTGLETHTETVTFH